MSIAGFFITRPVSTVLLTVSLLVMGVIGYKTLPVNALPKMDFPTISVTANLPGASPETMASSVAAVLEKRFSTIAGVELITSQSALGVTNVTVQFGLNRDIDAAAQDVQAAITAVLRALPKDMPTAPTYQKVNPAEQPILLISVNSTTLPLALVHEFAETIVLPRLATLPGVAQVNVFGGQKFAVRVQIDPLQLAARGIGIDEVSTAIDRANSNQPTGALSGDAQAITLKTTGQLPNAAAYRNMIVAVRGGAAVRLEDIANVVDSVENDKAAAWLRDARSVILAIQRQPGANSVQIVDAIYEVLPSIQEQLPAAMQIEPMFDRTVSIRHSVEDVQFTLLLTMCLVVMVIFMFLRNITATLIPGIVVPLSIIGTFAGMYAFGFSINNISLLALTLAVGFVVDDAVVVLENIYRHVEMGKSRMQAAIDGSREIGFTVVSMTISLVAVFIPVLFMPGIIGRLFFEFGVTISIAIIVSGTLSLTLTPMMASRLVREDEHNRQHGIIYRFFEGIFDVMLRTYTMVLDFCLRIQFIMLLVVFATIGFSVFFLREVPKGFIPAEDNGLIFVRSEGPDDASFDYLVRHQEAVYRIIQDHPAVDLVSRFLGVGGPNLTANSTRLFVRLKPRGQRKQTVNDVINELRPRLAQVPGMLTVAVPISAFPSLGGRQTRGQYQYVLQASDFGDLYTWSENMERALRDIKELTDVGRELALRSQQALVDIDRDRASALGISAAQIESALYNAFGGRQISTIYTPANQYQVIIELLPQFQRDLETLTILYVRGANGKLVPLDTLAKISRTTGPLAVDRRDQLPSAIISFNLAPGVSLGAATTRIKAVEGQVGLPASVISRYQGNAQVFQDSLVSLPLLLLAAMAVIYVVLGMLYESYIHPITILSGIPSAGVGALMTLTLIPNQELNLISFIGVIMLIGIVKKNAIMMIDFALEAQRNEGMTPTQAIRDACIKRFRPIMMTTMAAIMGTLPIAVGGGEGSELRQPLGLAVVGWLIVSQMLTLFITPVVYIYMEKLRALGMRLRGKARVAPAE